MKLLRNRFQKKHAVGRYVFLEGGSDNYMDEVEAEKQRVEAMNEKEFKEYVKQQTNKMCQSGHRPDVLGRNRDPWE